MNPPDRSSLSEFLTLPAILRFLCSRWRIVAAVFVLSGVVSAGLSFVIPRTYQTSCYIVVSPPPYATDLMPQAFSIQTYQMFIKNDAILDAVRRTAGLKKARLEDIRDMLASEVIREKYGTKVEFSPLIRLNAKGATPQEAASLADAWADEIKSRSGVLLGLAKGDTLAFIEKQYDDLKIELIPAEEALAQTGKKYEEQRKTIEMTYEKKAADFRAQWNLGRLKEESIDLNALVGESKANLANVRIDLQSARARLAALTDSLVRLQPVVSLKKTLSDDALLESVAVPRESKTATTTAGLSLSTEEANAVYQQVSGDAERVRSEVAHLEAQRKALETDIAKILAQADDVNRLYSQKNRELGDIALEKASALATLIIERDTQLAPLQRAVDKFRMTHKTLSEKAEAARMAKEEKTDIVKVASRAVLPTLPTRTSSRRFFVMSVTFIATCTAVVFMLLAQVFARLGLDSSKD